MPTPPLAMTGTPTASTTARVRARSKPSLVPSRSIDVSRISPAPSATARVAHSSASIPVGVRPPCRNTSKPPPWSAGRRLASIAHTTHWLPNSAAISPISSGRCTAAVFTLTLSAPARSIVRASPTERMPPPTVNGMNTCSAVRITTSTMVSRPSDEAVMSRKTSSSAPSASYRAASSTGSPASRRPTKLTPFTTRPPVTSRHGMTRGTITMPHRRPMRRRPGPPRTAPRTAPYR